MHKKYGLPKLDNVYCNCSFCPYDECERNYKNADQKPENQFFNFISTCDDVTKWMTKDWKTQR